MENRKYIFAFLVTAVIFGAAISVSNYFNRQKLAELQNIEDRISLDILSSETQSALLEESTCQSASATSTLTRELGDLSDKLSYAASQNSASDETVLGLKIQYSLLEIKDYLLMKKITAKCGNRPTFVLYFYSTEADCPDCQKMGYVLTALHDKYPDLRVYSFDYNLDLESIKTLLNIYGVKGPLPALIINGVPYYGFHSLESLESDVPAIKHLKETLPSPQVSAPSQN